MTEESFAAFQDVCLQSENYPRTLLSTRTPEYTLRVLYERFRERRDLLFCDDGNAAVSLWELSRTDEGYQPIRLANLRETWSHFGNQLTQCRTDPRQRYVFIEAPHSRDPLSITSSMFLYMMTYLQVMPAFLELIFPFGLSLYAEGFHFTNFTAENRMREAERGLHLTTLRRSGRQTEVCYNLKSVERTPDPNNPWSLRQCSVYNRFDMESAQATWIIVKGNSLMQDLVKTHTRTELANSQRLDSEISAFGSLLNVHSILAAWAGENWHWYINDVEEKLQSITRPAFAMPLGNNNSILDSRPESRSHRARMQRPRRKWTMKSLSTSLKRSFSWSTVWTGRSTILDEKVCPIIEEDRVRDHDPVEEEEEAEEGFSFEDLQRVHFVQEKASELQLVLKSNCNVLGSLKNHFTALAKHEDFPESTAAVARYDITSFLQGISDIVGKLEMQQSRVETLMQLIVERKSVLHAILQHKNMEANNQLAQEAKISARKMEEMTEEMHELARKTKTETSNMRIITLVTLFFLPGTFISTLMSTPIVKFGSQSSGFSNQNIGYGALEFFVTISVPLVCLTFAAWYFVYLWEKRKDKRRVEQTEGGQALV